MTVRAYGLKVVRYVVEAIAVDVVDVELGWALSDKATLLAVVLLEGTVKGGVATSGLCPTLGAAQLVRGRMKLLAALETRSELYSAVAVGADWLTESLEAIEGGKGRPALLTNAPGPDIKADLTGKAILSVPERLDSRSTTETRNRRSVRHAALWAFLLVAVGHREGGLAGHADARVSSHGPCPPDS